MKLWRKFKYALLKWLLNDICEKSGKCAMCYINMGHCQCGENSIFKQARMIWRLEEEK